MMVAFFNLCKKCVLVSKDKESRGQTGTYIFLLSLMTPIPFHGLVSRLNLSVFVSLPICPLSLSFSLLHALHLSVFSQSIMCTLICYRPSVGYTRPWWMLFNCMWVSSLSVLKPKDMEFVSLPVQQPQGAVCELTALLESGP